MYMCMYKIKYYICCIKIIWKFEMRLKKIMYIFGMYILYIVVFFIVIMLYVMKFVCIFVLEIGEVYFVILFFK